MDYRKKGDGNFKFGKRETIKNCETRKEFYEWIEIHIRYSGKPPYPTRLKEMRTARGISEKEVQEMITTAIARTHKN